MRVSINMGKNAQAMQSTTTAQSDIGYKEKKTSSNLQFIFPGC